MSEAKTAMISGNDGASLQFAISIRHLNTSEKFFQSFKKFAIFFGLALIAVFIPVLHFVLVPLLLLGGILAAVSSFLKQGSMLEKVTYNCPSCSHEMTLNNRPAHFPIKDTCPKCRKQYRIELP